MKSFYFDILLTTIIAGTFSYFSHYNFFILWIVSSFVVVFFNRTNKKESK